MDDVVLTFYCASIEADAIAQTLRREAGRPVHVRQEVVHGRDFSDANVGEQVTGTLARAAVEVIAPRDGIDALVAAVAATRRSHPVRWRVIPLIAQGRIV